MSEHEGKALTEEQIKAIRPSDDGVHFYRAKVLTDELRALCDMALRSLGQSNGQTDREITVADMHKAADSLPNQGWDAPSRPFNMGQYDKDAAPLGAVEEVIHFPDDCDFWTANQWRAVAKRYHGEWRDAERRLAELDTTKGKI